MTKKFSLIAVFIFVFSACSTDELKLVNPNQPTKASLTSETGVKAYATGIYEKFLGSRNDLENGNSGFMSNICMMNNLGDDGVIHYGNFGWRFYAVYNKITLPNGTSFPHTIAPYISMTSAMQNFNSRAAGDRNGTKYEWYSAYLTIGQCNALLESLDKTISFSGNAVTKKATLQAWALWWKGFMYSRIGSLYLGGIINNKVGETNGNYKDRTEIIVEANRNLDLAVALLAAIDPADADYTSTLNGLVPRFNGTGISAANWVRMINTMKARNLVVNKKVSQMTAADWGNVVTLCNAGMTASDTPFNYGMSSDGNNDLAINFWHTNYLANVEQDWIRVSERLVQEYKPGDQRRTKNFIPYPYDGGFSPAFRNRGWTFATTWAFKDVESGGTFATAANQGLWPISPTYEENQLMLAEAKIRTGQLDQGLVHVDNVRTFQGAGIANVSGTGLNTAQAIEEFRRERRAAMALWGLSFYDARRWGVIDKQSAGGGRSNANVLVPANIYDPEADGLPAVYPCFIEYDYAGYWDLPANELDFNKPLEGSVAVKQ
jgi:starch-binding outer membrane protein, SusD/RagB family